MNFYVTMKKHFLVESSKATKFDHKITVGIATWKREFFSFLFLTLVGGYGYRRALCILGLGPSQFMQTKLFSRLHQMQTQL